jgi:hypothetical protein
LLIFIFLQDIDILFEQERGGNKEASSQRYIIKRRAKRAKIITRILNYKRFGFLICVATINYQFSEA